MTPPDERFKNHFYKKMPPVFREHFLLPYRKPNSVSPVMACKTSNDGLDNHLSGMRITAHLERLKLVTGDW